MSLKRIGTFIFHIQSLLLIPVLLFLWYTINAFYGYTITERDLISHTGNLIRNDTVYVGDSKAVRTRTNGYYIRLGLDTEPSRLFRLFYTPHRYHVLTRLKRGDRVTIFTEPELFARNRREVTIMKLVSGERVIMEYSKLSHRISSTLLLIFLPLFLGFFLLYFFTARRRFRAICQLFTDRMIAYEAAK